MRILFICASLRAGGAERVLTKVANHFSTSHEVAIATFADADSFYMLAKSIPHFRPDLNYGSGWFSSIRKLKHIRAAAKSFKPDIIIVFGALISSVVHLATIGAKKRIIAANRASPTAKLWGFRPTLNRLIYPFFDAVILQTHKAENILRPSYPFTKFKVIGNPIKIPQVITPISERAKRLITVGTLMGSKNHQALIRILSRVPKFREWDLLIVGDGPLRAELEHWTRKLGLSDRIHFLGTRSDVYSLLKSSRIFAFTSLSEGFPNALAEAMACGCTPVSYDCLTGPSELIEDGKNGFLVEPGDEIGFQARLEALMTDKDLCERLGKQARTTVRRFEESSIFAEFDALL